MDPNLIAQNPLVKKLGALAGIVILLEIGVFVLVSWLAGFGTAVLITFAFTILGFSIKPFKNPFEEQKPSPAAGMNPLADFTSTRKLAGTLFMIPGFLTDLAAIIILIPPFRKGISSLATKIAAKKMSKMMGGSFDPAMFAKMAENMKNMNGMGGMGGFGNMGGFGATSGQTVDTETVKSTSSSSKPKSGSEARREKRERRKQQAQTVDVDYEVRDGDGIWIGGHANSPTDMRVAMKHTHALEASKEDVIDVDAEWK